MKYISFQQQAIEIEITYYQNLLAYNQAVIEANYLTY
jgi:hypothetical protein